MGRSRLRHMESPDPRGLRRAAAIPTVRAMFSQSCGLTRHPAAILCVAAALLLGGPAAHAQTPDAALFEAQQILLMMGLAPGKPDGKPNPHTAHALQEYQRTAGLPATGKLDERTLDGLRKVRDTKFSGTLGGKGAPGEAPRPRVPEIETKPQAAPIAPVASEQLAPPPGVAGTSSAPPPALFQQPATPSGAGQAFAPVPAAAPVAPAPEAGALLGWTWLIPLGLLPVFLGLLWFGWSRASRTVSLKAPPRPPREAVEPRL